MKYLILFVVSLGLFACGDAATKAKDTMSDAASGAQEMASDAATKAKEMADDAATSMTSPNAEAATFLGATVEAVQSVGGDITALSPEAAATNVEGWISKLSDVEGAGPLVEDLSMLKKEFTEAGDEPLNGASISKLLASMAEKTRGMSDKAQGLDMLANVLDAGAKKLAGE